jgi:hypothetical protein
MTRRWDKVFARLFASALTVFLLAVLMGIAALSFGLLERRIHYEV